MHSSVVGFGEENDEENGDVSKIEVEPSSKEPGELHQFDRPHKVAGNSSGLRRVIGFGEDNDEEIGGFSKKVKPSTKKLGGFHQFGLNFQVMKGIQKKGYRCPTPIQRKTIPLAIQGRDVVAMARTGSGKTACFLLPLFEKLQRQPSTSTIRSLILSPTRELAIQTLKFVKEIGKFTKIRYAVVLGGDAMETQFSAIHTNPDLIIATPGRFLHVCVEMSLDLSNIEYVVFDEADRLFEMGFGEQLREILRRLPEHRQTLLFSATLPKVLVEFARAGLLDPVLVRLDVDSKLPTTLDLSFAYCNSDDKPAALLSLLSMLPTGHQAIIFAATKHHVEYINKLLQCAGFSSTFIYSDLDSTARKINAAKFQKRNVKCLVVTDIAARGLDIPQLDVVINYNFPAKAKLFVHRVGRCARAGRKGHAYSLISIDETCYFLDLLLFLGRPLNLLQPGSKANTENAVGSIPKTLLEEMLSRVQHFHSSDSDLDSLAKVMNNGYKKYLQSRPGASRESLKRAKEISWSGIDFLPIFASSYETEIEKANFLSQMKQYRPRGTIFEIGQSSTSTEYNVMKEKRYKHKTKILSHHQKLELRTNEEKGLGERPTVSLESCNYDDISTTFNSIITGNKRKLEQPEHLRKRTKIKDENYIPYEPVDSHTEMGLAVNNFRLEASKAVLDLTGDNEQSMGKSGRARMIWDKRKKKMVGVNNNSKVGKIKTESGAWIPATYKSGRYKQWVELNRIDENDSGGSDNDDAEKDSSSKPKFKNNTLHTHWGRHNAKLEKKMKFETKKPELILKERERRERLRLKNKPKKKKKGKKRQKAKKGKKNA